MPRWKGDARGRLERAALELFDEQGYDRTTVAQITHRAGLTERSFYRWFTDKREVLFAGDELEERLLAGIDAVPAGAAPLATLLAAFAAVPEVLRPGEFLSRRAPVIAANSALQERELIKLAGLSEALMAALCRRGIPPRTARMAVGAGLAVLRSATERWVDDEAVDFADLLEQAAVELRDVVTAPGGPSRDDRSDG